jgi:hypothetical protein
VAPCLGGLVASTSANAVNVPEICIGTNVRVLMSPQNRSDPRYRYVHSCKVLQFSSAALPRDAQVAALKTGLQALVSRCPIPILGGIVVPLPPDVLDRGMELVVRDLRTAMTSFEELEAAKFPSSHLPYNLLMPIPQGHRQ